MSASISITISPLQFVSSLLEEQPQPDLVISVLGAADALGRQAKNPPWPEIPNSIPTLRLEFDDVGYDQKRGGVLPTRFFAPTAHHLLALRDYVQHACCNRILVHCRAGSSRSPAVAGIVASLLGATHQQLEALFYLKNYYRPSAAVLSLSDNLGLTTSPLLPFALETRSWTQADKWAPASLSLSVPQKCASRTVTSTPNTQATLESP